MGHGDRLPLHLLLVSNTESPTYIQGADRDWVNLLSALGPSRVRVTWAGVRGTEALREHLPPAIITRCLDLDFTPFYEFFHATQYRRRTLRNWAGLTLGHGKDTMRAARLLRRALDEDTPDVVVTNTSVVLAGAAYALWARLPHVWCVKEFLDERAPCSRVYARLIELASAEVVVPSGPMAAAFKRRFRVLRDGNDVAAIRAGVRDRDRARVLRSVGLPAELPVIAQVGALSEAKGQHVTAAAFARLAGEGSPPASLLFLGSSAPGPKERIMEALAVAPAAWRDRVRFAEFVSGDYSLMAAADVIVHPSVIPDPYPNAVREALALGKPVVGSRAGGVSELITDGETGLLVEPGDAISLAAALNGLLNSPAKRSRLGAAAGRSAGKELDIRACAENFYNLLLALAPGARHVWPHGARMGSM